RSHLGFRCWRRGRAHQDRQDRLCQNRRRRPRTHVAQLQTLASPAGATSAGLHHEQQFRILALPRLFIIEGENLGGRDASIVAATAKETFHRTFAKLKFFHWLRSGTESDEPMIMPRLHTWNTE